ncbi:hypothetical protein BDZ45DRAFT_750931 [Acephala macrosclerotiorum]|nr:hypothetical protein BDZ45DRAFT_750931 [Acephala macrosclerotiorum]
MIVGIVLAVDNVGLLRSLEPHVISRNWVIPCFEGVRQPYKGVDFLGRLITRDHPVVSLLGRSPPLLPRLNIENCQKNPDTRHPEISEFEMDTLINVRAQFRHADVFQYLRHPGTSTELETHNLSYRFGMTLIQAPAIKLSPKSRISQSSGIRFEY